MPGLIDPAAMAALVQQQQLDARQPPSGVVYAPNVRQPPAPNPSTPKDALLAMLMGKGLDATSTQMALRRPGLAEGNPIFGSNPWVNGGLNILQAIGLARGMKLLASHGHPTAARAVGYGAGGAFAATGAHNLALMAGAQ